LRSLKDESSMDEVLESMLCSMVAAIRVALYLACSAIGPEKRSSTVDDLFSGPMAEHAKTCAVRIAATMEHNISPRPSSIDAWSLIDRKELGAAADHNRSGATE